MKWTRVTRLAGYEAETEHGKFMLTHPHASNGRRTFKYRVWVLWVDGRVVRGSRRYRLLDAKAFAEKHLATLEAKRVARLARQLERESR